MDDQSINKNLTDDQRIFFNNFSIYIDLPLYFYGSIYRNDYFPGKSDIDIDIFTDNEYSTIQSICNYLKLDKTEFRKSFYKIDTHIVRGYKGKYKDETKDINVELSVYNNKYKDLVIKDHNRCKTLPFYISVILIFVKFCYYTLGIITIDTYRILKQNLMNPNSEFKFILIDTKI